ncbi:MAG: hypothetical protein F6J96_30795 [Symploca sp. SIO1C2]|nr:hypothetical protein [Symploca sp. SIO1C2]
MNCLYHISHKLCYCCVELRFPRNPRSHIHDIPTVIQPTGFDRYGFCGRINHNGVDVRL